MNLANHVAIVTGVGRGIGNPNRCNTEAAG